MIGRRQLSPVELAQACIARVEALDPAVNAVVARNFDRLMDEAHGAEAAVARGEPLGALHGLPVAIKDMNDVAGLPTTYGSEIFADNVPDSDDSLVASVRAAGGLILGKTNVPEWSAGANTRNRVFGVTANPYDLERTCAGSSGGSAVALATRMAPLATGSDLGGSLRNPAAYCGVVGFRPSPGVVPGTTSEMALLPMSTSGPMARTAADAALLLSVLSRPDRRDPWSQTGGGRAAAPDSASLAPLRAPDLSRLRVAATEDFGFAPTESVVREAFRDRVRRLASHLRIEHATPDCPQADRIFAVLRAVGFLGTHRDRMERYPEKVGPNVRANVEEGLRYSARDVAEALAAQAVYYRAWQNFFESVDFVLSPAVTVSPRNWRELYPAEIDGQPTQSYYHWLALAYATTIAGHPSVTIPCGTDANRMPFGLQIVGRRNDDAGVLAVAAELEAVISSDASMRLSRPDLDALAAARPLREVEGFRDL
ncbi:amidase [Rhodobacteraceae bacterium MCCB 386]|nr:amidase [Roseitranquillus sediminis]